MSKKELFSDTLAIKVWNQYFRRIDLLSKGLTAEQREELRLEIQDHLYESFMGEKGKSEGEKLLNAIEKIGDPEIYVKPLMADHLFISAKKTYNPKTILKGLYYYVFGSVKRLFISIFYALGYLLVVLLGLMTLLKPIFPSKVGLFLHESGSISFGLIFKGAGKFGIILDGTPMKEELLGFWIIPVCIILSLLLYLLLTKRLPQSKDLRFLKRKGD